MRQADTQLSTWSNSCECIPLHNSYMDRPTTDWAAVAGYYHHVCTHRMLLLALLLNVCQRLQSFRCRSSNGIEQQQQHAWLRCKPERRAIYAVVAVSSTVRDQAQRWRSICGLHSASALFCSWQSWLIPSACTFSDNAR